MANRIIKLGCICATLSISKMHIRYDDPSLDEKCVFLLWFSVLSHILYVTLIIDHVGISISSLPFSKTIISPKVSQGARALHCAISNRVTRGR